MIPFVAQRLLFSPKLPALQAVLQRGALFLPWLKHVAPDSVQTRVGLRPFSAAGSPLIGPVAPNVVVAAGHEGAGLAMGPATAEVVAAYVMEEAQAAPWAPSFLPAADMVSL